MFGDNLYSNSEDAHFVLDCVNSHFTQKHKKSDIESLVELKSLWMDHWNILSQDLKWLLTLENINGKQMDKQLIENLNKTVIKINEEILKDSND